MRFRATLRETVLFGPRLQCVPAPPAPNLRPNSLPHRLLPSVARERPSRAADRDGRIGSRVEPSRASGGVAERLASPKPDGKPDLRAQPATVAGGPQLGKLC